MSETGGEIGSAEMLIRAADAAGDAALGFDLFSNIRPPWNLRETEEHTVGLFPPQRQLLAASGPDHWRAVEAMFRGQAAFHKPGHGSCQVCDRFGRCSGTQSLGYLAEQVLHDLGEES